MTRDQYCSSVDHQLCTRSVMHHTCADDGGGVGAGGLSETLKKQD
jgi:hypothetical protein